MTVMNMALKARIVYKFGSQSNFCEKAHERESYVSRVINGRETAPLIQQKKWARILKCEVSELWPS